MELTSARETTEMFRFIFDDFRHRVKYWIIDKP